MACATVKIGMTNLASDEKNNLKYLQHNGSRNSARRSALVDDEQKFGSMCGGAQTTFIIWVILLHLGIAMTAKVNGGCYIVLQRSVSKKQLLKQVFSLFQYADESVIVVLR